MYRIAIRLGAMRYRKVSHMCIFPSDGTNRIRFTGKDYRIHSQPDASGPPKTYVLCDKMIITFRLGMSRVFRNYL